VAYATTQTAGSDGTNVCVNDANGLVRVSQTCRDGEHPLTIGGGGGGNARATQNGTFTVPWGQTGGAKQLPLTGVTLSGRCETFPGPFGGEGANARLFVETPTGQTMDAFPGPFGSSGTGVSSLLLNPAASFVPGMATSGGSQYAILTANGATATLTVGGAVNPDASTCAFLWQAVETAN
jgi:hypothetical protein